jgi:hypothetical protein
VDARRIARSFLKVLAASCIMGLVGWALLHGELWEKGGNTLEKTVYFSGAFIVCIGVYLGFCLLLRNEELGYVIGMLKAKIKRKEEFRVEN